MNEEITLGLPSLMLNPSFPFMLLMQRVGEEDVSRCVGVYGKWQRICDVENGGEGMV